MDRVVIYRRLIAYYVGQGKSRIDADRAAKAALPRVESAVSSGKSLDDVLAGLGAAETEETKPEEIEIEWSEEPTPPPKAARKRTRKKK